MDVSETKDIVLLNKAHFFELVKSHIYEPDISLISLVNLMFKYAKPRLTEALDSCSNYKRIVIFLLNTAPGAMSQVLDECHN